MARFIKTPEGYTLDEDTGLVWNLRYIRNKISGEIDTLNRLCTNASKNGIFYWRLPNDAELMVLRYYLDEIYDRKIMMLKALGLQEGCYWTETVEVQSSSCNLTRHAVNFNLTEHIHLCNSYPFNIENYVALVRSADNHIPKRVAAQISIEQKFKEDFF